MIGILDAEGPGGVGGVEGIGGIGGVEALEGLADKGLPDIAAHNAETSRIPSVNTALKFINALKSARLEDDKLNLGVLE